MRDPTGNEFVDFCTVLGLMTVTWAYIENALGIMLGTITDRCGPVKGHREIPRSFKPRVDCFKIALRDIPFLKPLSQDGRALAMRLTELSRRRNELVHRSAIHLGKGAFEAIALTTVGWNYTIENHRFDVSDAAHLNMEIAEFCSDVIDFMARVDAVFADSHA
jgi:hypothetical protein